MIAANARLLIAAFEAAGLEFIPENGGGAGIRFRSGRAEHSSPTVVNRPLGTGLVDQPLWCSLIYVGEA